MCIRDSATTATHASISNSNDSTILIIGDSLSAGLGVAYNQSWPSLLQDRLNKNGYTIQVVNAGISGDTTAGGNERLPKLLSQYAPEIVVIELGGNDGLRGTSIDSIESNLRSMIEATLDRDAQIILIGMQLPPNYGNAYATSFQNLFPTLASEYELVLVERLIQRMMNEVWQQSLMQMDGSHPNAKGHGQIENLIWDSMAPLLGKICLRKILKKSSFLWPFSIYLVAL